MQFLVKLFESLHHFFPAKDKHGKSINCTAFCNLALFCFVFCNFFAVLQSRKYVIIIVICYCFLVVLLFIFSYSFSFTNLNFLGSALRLAYLVLISAFFIFILYNIKLYFSLCIFLNSFFIAF